MELKLLLILLSVIQIQLKFSFAKDYCSQSYKCNRNGTEINSIGCNEKKFAKNCPDHGSILTEDLKDLTLETHNKYREALAEGVDGLPSGYRFCRLVWDHDLADLAEYNLKQCKGIKDDCHNTEKFKNTGQNIAIIPKNKEVNSYDIAVEEAVRKWFFEEDFIGVGEIEKFDVTKNYANFAQLAYNEVRAIGCAVIYFGGKQNAYHVLCNYSHAPKPDEPIYNTDPESQDCKYTDGRYPHVCHVSEALCQI